MKYLHKFSACWCQPCRMLSNALKEVDLESLGIVVAECDVDLMDRAELQRLGVRGVPTLILMDSDGVELSRKTGVLLPKEIIHWLGEQDARLPLVR